MAINKKTDQVFVGSSPKPLPLTGKPFDPITRYLLDELKRQQSLINQLAQAVVVVADAEPASLRKGMVRRAISPWDPLGNGYEGLVEFDGTAWKASGTDFATLTATPDTVLGYDSSGDAALFSATPFARTLIDDANAGAARTTLGLGTAATLNVGTGANNVVQLDGSSKLPAVDGSQLTGINSVPTGVVIPYAGASAPTGYLLCDGSAVSRTTYAALFTAISTTYGAGDGSTTFNLPDLRGRVVAGQDNMGGTSANRLTNTYSGGIDGDVLGGTGGEEAHQLTVAELAAHTHNVDVRNNLAARTSGGVNTAVSITTVATTSAGGDMPHNNVQPTIILNYIIKT